MPRVVCRAGKMRWLRSSHGWQCRNYSQHRFASLTRSVVCVDMMLHSLTHSLAASSNHNVAQRPRRSSTTWRVALTHMQRPCYVSQVFQGMCESNRWLAFRLMTERPRLASPNDGKQFFFLTQNVTRNLTCVGAHPRRGGLNWCCGRCVPCYAQLADRGVACSDRLL